MTKILKNYSILYVEDEPIIQQNIREYLESYFDKVYVASDGKEALVLYYAHCPDVMLLDINLPYVSGLEVAKQIRQENASIKIIMLTAYTDTEKLLAATELKLTKYLVKPIEPKLFKETMLYLSKELLANPVDFVYVALNCTWHKKEEVLYVDKVPVDLSEKEHRLFKLLLEHKGSTVGYEDIMLAVWEDAFDKEISLDSIKNQVLHLRKKLPENCINTVYGQGYILK